MKCPLTGGRNSVIGTGGARPKKRALPVPILVFPKRIFHINRHQPALPCLPPTSLILVP